MGVRSEKLEVRSEWSGYWLWVVGYGVWGGNLEMRQSNTPKPRKEQKMWCPFSRGKEHFFADEERRGGVAAIEQPR